MYKFQLSGRHYEGGIADLVRIKELVRSKGVIYDKGVYSLHVITCTNNIELMTVKVSDNSYNVFK